MSRTYRRGFTRQRLSDEDFSVFVYRWPDNSTYVWSSFQSRKMRPYCKYNNTWWSRGYKGRTNLMRRVDITYKKVVRFKFKKQIKDELHEGNTSNLYGCYEEGSGSIGS